MAAKGLRITSGELRGRFVPPPLEPGSRPLIGRIRQSLCDYLGPTLEGETVLDLFAGTGVVAIEMLSRGAEKATLVESSGRTVKQIASTVGEFGLGERALVLKGDVLRPERWFHVEHPGAPWSVVFVGTPYHLTEQSGGWKKITAALAKLDEAGAFSPEAVLVLQYERGHEPDLQLPGWAERPEERRTSGKTGFAFWRRSTQPG
jgi:16S rRNA (guanine966-N2)-methyltransferase